MIRIVLIGSGGTIPSIQRAMPCLAMKYDKVFLFDIGEGTQRELIRHKVPFGSIDSIFISHLHLDHFLGLYGLLETLRLNDFKGKLNVFAPKGFKLIKRFDFVDLKLLEEGKIYFHKDFEISAFKTNHEESSFGFKVEFRPKRVFMKEKLKALSLENIPGLMFKKLLEKGKIIVSDKIIRLEEVTQLRKSFSMVYTSDTQYSDNVITHSKDVDLLFHEATYLSKDKHLALERKHSTIKDALEVFQKSNAKKLVLVHISNRYLEKEIKDEICRFSKELKISESDVIIGYDGLTFYYKH
ncbi:MAG: MBL fold metallo-hydrolase [Candidatus Micrarchaeota archaeon]|nr:MBL fold metallo-hydrolase [Candidatus Micrarchaeota archaeon]